MSRESWDGRRGGAQKRGDDAGEGKKRKKVHLEDSFVDFPPCCKEGGLKGVDFKFH